MMKTELPKEIRIGPAVYKIIRLQMEDDMGNCDVTKNEIKIDNTLSETRAFATLFHEILHGCAHEFNAEVPRKQEESMVRAIESGLLSLSYDEPDILRRIFRL